MSEQRHLFYLRTRKFVADRIKVDFQSKTRYQSIDPFAIGERLIPQGLFETVDYSTVGDFFAEVTGEVQKVSHWDRDDYEYETYFDEYQIAIYQYLSDIVPRHIYQNALSRFNFRLRGIL